MDFELRLLTSSIVVLRKLNICIQVTSIYLKRFSFGNIVHDVYNELCQTCRNSNLVFLFSHREKSSAYTIKTMMVNE